MTAPVQWAACEHCGSRAGHCEHYPRYANGFRARCELAAHCLRTGNGLGSRGFDNCFEMFDGNFVVRALDMWRNDDPALARGIAAFWRSDEACAGFEDAAAQLRHITCFERLTNRAALHRLERKFDHQHCQGELFA